MLCCQEINFQPVKPITAKAIESIQIYFGDHHGVLKLMFEFTFLPNNRPFAHTVNSPISALGAYYFKLPEMGDFFDFLVFKVAFPCILNV